MGDQLLRYHGALWTKRKARKAAKCWMSGRPINVGDEVYGPLTNKGFRMKRILASVVESEDSFHA